MYRIGESISYWAVRKYTLAKVFFLSNYSSKIYDIFAYGQVVKSPHVFHKPGTSGLDQFFFYSGPRLMVGMGCLVNQFDLIRGDNSYVTLIRGDNSYSTLVREDISYFTLIRRNNSYVTLVWADNLYIRYPHKGR